MKLFSCQVCGQVLTFENRWCEHCQSSLGYLPGATSLSALERAGNDWRALADGRPYRFCANAEDDVCNWMVAPDHSRFCEACRHNGVIPALTDPANLLAWRKIEAAKHRLVYALLRLQLPLQTREESPEHGLQFRFLADPSSEDQPKVMTGHDSGVITIALVEADDPERERRRTTMGEPYRTLLGHFRHEVGHHFWDVLVRDADRLEECRAVFGDDRADYEAALRRHYEQGPRGDWRLDYVSAYATTHPWEDFAETWAHYLHIIDSVETATSFGLRINPSLDRTGLMAVEIDFDPYDVTDFRRVSDAWLPLTFAMNEMARSMGQPDFYPFILPPAVIAKLSFVHDLVRSARAGGR